MTALTRRGRGPGSPGQDLMSQRAWLLTRAALSVVTTSTLLVRETGSQAAPSICDGATLDGLDRPALTGVQSPRSSRADQTGCNGFRRTNFAIEAGVRGNASAQGVPKVSPRYPQGHALTMTA